MNNLYETLNFGGEYERFINECKNKEVDAKYHHKHHIIPVCVDGPDIDSNKLLIAFEDHWYAHKILAEQNPNSDELQQAFTRLGTLKQFVARAKKSKDKVFTEEQKRKMAHPGKQNGMYGRDRSGEKNPMFGVHRYGEDSPNWGKHSNKGQHWKLIDGKRVYYTA